MTIDHYAIAAQLCLTRACKDPGPCPDLEAAYLDLHDEVQRLRADLRHVIDERDATFALMLARAEKAEAERDALRAALESIANNTCCDGCQEAALVARAALKGDDND